MMRLRGRRDGTVVRSLAVVRGGVDDALVLTNSRGWSFSGSISGSFERAEAAEVSNFVCRTRQTVSFL